MRGWSDASDSALLNQTMCKKYRSVCLIYQTYAVSLAYAKFFSSQIIINMARKICDFNHISTELNREQIDELIGYYKTTHQKWFLYKKAHKHYKLIKYAARLTSGTIAGGGIASVIVSGSVLTIISLGASLLIEILLDYKNVNENMNNCKYAYQSYQHLMIQIKTALRLGQYNIQNLVNSIANLDNFFVDICPLVDKYKKDYYKNIATRRMFFYNSHFISFNNSNSCVVFSVCKPIASLNKSI